MVKSFKSYNKFNYRADDLFTCGMGKLIPYRMIDVLPGDIWNFTHIPLSRMQALISPAMGELVVRLHNIFVPYRLIWPKWYEGFMIPTLNADGSLTTATIPTITKTWTKGSLGDYFGYPLGVSFTSDALWTRAYQKAVKDWYMNLNIEDESDVALSTADGVDTTTSTDIYNVNWPKDYFTGLMPFKQRGPEVTLPLGDMAPVFTGDVNYGLPSSPSGLVLRTVDGSSVADGSYDIHGWHGTGLSSTDINLVKSDASGTFGSGKNVMPVNLYADMAQAVGLHPSEFRLAWQLNQKLIMDMRGGSRPVEWLREHYGVRCSDARLQRSEFLGGSKSYFNISEVLQTSSTDSTTPQGNMAGHGFSVFKSKNRKKYFEEHGVIVCLMSICPKAVYMQGAPRQALKRTPEEFGLPVLSHTIQDAVFKGQLYWSGTSTDTEPLGYRNIYDEYRHMYSKVAGEFRDTLDYWTWARKFSSQPVLNKSFIQVESIDRPFATRNEDHFLVDIKTIARAYRKLPKRGVPGLIDHN